MKKVIRFELGKFFRDSNGKPFVKFGNAEMSSFTHVGPVAEVSFNHDGTVKRAETINAIYIQVKP